MIRQPDYDRIDVVLPGAETGKKWDDEIGEWVVDDEFVEEDEDEPIPSVEDDEAGERLLMLLSLPEASVSEILRAAAGCYSARLSEHASFGGDSSELIAALPLNAHARLSAFLAQPAIRAQLDNELASDEEERRALLALLDAFPASTTAGASSSSSSAVAPTQPPPVESPPSPESPEMNELNLDGAVEFDSQADDDEEDEEGAEVRDAAEQKAKAAAWAAATAAATSEDADEYKGNNSSKGSSPNRPPPVWTHRPLQARCGGGGGGASSSSAQSTPNEMLKPHELGWHVEDEDDDEHPNGGGSAASSSLLAARPSPNAVVGDLLGLDDAEEEPPRSPQSSSKALQPPLYSPSKAPWEGAGGNEEVIVTSPAKASPTRIQFSAGAALDEDEEEDDEEEGLPQVGQLRLDDEKEEEGASSAFPVYSQNYYSSSPTRAAAAGGGGGGVDASSSGGELPPWLER